MQVAQRDVQASNLQILQCWFEANDVFPVMSKRTMLYNILRMVAWRWLWRQNQWVTCTQETLDELVKTKSDAAPSTQDISLPISSTNFVSFMVATWDCLHLLGSACQTFSAFVRQLLSSHSAKGPSEPQPEPARKRSR